MTRRTRSRVPSSAYKMAVFTTLTLLLLGVLATLIGNISLAPSRSYTAVFTDATGVTKGDRVRLSGVEVGRVTGTDLVRDGERSLARVEFEVDRDVPVYRSATLQLRFENIVGQRYVALEEQPGDDVEMPEGGTFDTSSTRPALNLTVLFNGFQPLFRALQPAELNRLSYQLVRTLQGEGGTFASLLRSTASLTDELADRDRVIGGVIRNLNAVLGTVDRRDTQLTALIVQFRNLMAGLSADRDAIDKGLPGLADLLGATAGTLREVRGPLAADIRQLDVLSGHLDSTSGVLDDSLKRLPHKLRVLARTGSYGSYFNFHVCGVEVNLQLLGGTYYLGTPSVATNETDTACAGGDG